MTNDIADFDADGDMDIVVTGKYENTVYCYMNNTPPNWNKVLIEPSLSGANEVYVVDMIDNGDSDIIVTGWNSHEVVWYDNERIFDPIEKLQDLVPQDYSLSQNYPNPFNPTTTISWQLAVGSPVQLEVFNLVGQKVATLVNEKQPAGSYSIEFYASHLASGVYLYRLQAGDYVETRKMVLMK